MGRWYVDDKKVCREPDGAAEGLLVYKSTQFVGIDTICNFKGIQRKGEQYELFMACRSEGEDAGLGRELLEVKQNELIRTVLEGKKSVSFRYTRCPL